MRPSRLLPLAGLVALAATTAQAAPPLSLELNHSARLHLSGPAGSVVVGSPTLVDVSVVDSRTVFVSGKAPGSTDVTVIDPLGRTVYSGEVVVGAGRSVSVFRGAARSSLACSPTCSDGTAPPADPTAAGISTLSPAAQASAPATLPLLQALGPAGGGLKPR